MSSFFAGRSGLAVRDNGGRVGSSDLNQIADALLAGKRVILDLIGGEAIYSGGAANLAAITSGTQYPAVTIVVADDAGNLWPFKTTSATAITFNVTSTAAGDARLYAVPALLAGVSPAAADGRYNQITFVCDDVANAAPAHSLLLGTGTVTASALTAYTAATLTPAAAQIVATAAAHKTSHENGGSDEISVAGLSGELADAQTPKTHASSHAAAGSDPLTGYALLAAANTFTANQEISGTSPEAKLTETDKASRYGRLFRAADVLTLADQQTKTDATVLGTALSLAVASSQYASSASGDNDMSGNSWSIEAWVKVTSYSTSGTYIRGITGKNRNNGGVYFRFGDGSNLSNNNKLGVGIGSGSAGYGFIATDTVSTGAWHHVAVTCDGSNVRFYVDGALDSGGAQAYVAGTGWYSDVIVVGSDTTASPTSRPFDGLLDEVAWWNKTLSGAEITARYNSGVGSRLAGNETNLVYAWHFDENTGTTAANAVATQPTLDLQNSATWATGIVPSSGGTTSTVEVAGVTIKDATVAGNEGRVELGETASELMMMRMGFTRDTKFGPPTGGTYYTGERSTDAAGTEWYYTGTGWVQHAPGRHGTWTGGGATDITTAANWNGGALLDGYMVIGAADGILWEYDTGLTKWLGTRGCIHIPGKGAALSAADTAAGHAALSDDYDLSFIECSANGTEAAGTFDSSNRWQVTFYGETSATSSTTTIANVNVNTGSGGADATRRSSVSVSMSPATYDRLRISIGKVGSPPNYTPKAFSLTYRLARA